MFGQYGLAADRAHRPKPQLHLLCAQKRIEGFMEHHEQTVSTALSGSLE
jgi:hypothetical protein